jgi:hypothetical protein
MALIISLGTCKKEAPAAEPPGAVLPELGISLYIPPGFSALEQEKLEQLQAQSRDMPVEPFEEIPRYCFASTEKGAFFVVSEMKLNEGMDSSDQVTNLYLYQKNYETLLNAELDSREFIEDGYRLLLMSLLIANDSGNLLLMKALYAADERCFQLSFYINQERAVPEDGEIYQKVLRSPEFF